MNDREHDETVIRFTLLLQVATLIYGAAFWVVTALVGLWLMTHLIVLAAVLGLAICWTSATAELWNMPKIASALFFLAITIGGFTLVGTFQALF